MKNDPLSNSAKPGRNLSSVTNLLALFPLSLHQLHAFFPHSILAAEHRFEKKITTMFTNSQL